MGFVSRLRGLGHLRAELRGASRGQLDRDPAGADDVIALRDVPAEHIAWYRPEVPLTDGSLRQSFGVEAAGSDPTRGRVRFGRRRAG